MSPSATGSVSFWNETGGGSVAIATEELLVGDELAEELTQLHTLNLGHNQLKSIAGLEGLSATSAEASGWNEVVRPALLEHMAFTAANCTMLYPGHARLPQTANLTAGEPPVMPRSTLDATCLEQRSTPERRAR